MIAFTWFPKGPPAGGTIPLRRGARATTLPNSGAPGTVSAKHLLTFWNLSCRGKLAMGLLGVKIKEEWRSGPISKVWLLFCRKDLFIPPIHYSTLLKYYFSEFKEIGNFISGEYYTSWTIADSPSFQFLILIQRFQKSVSTSAVPGCRSLVMLYIVGKKLYITGCCPPDEYFKWMNTLQVISIFP